MRMVKAEYYRAMGASEAERFDAALRSCERAGVYLTMGLPHDAAEEYDIAAFIAPTEDGARVLRLMAGEVRFGLLTGGTRH